MFLKTFRVRHRPGRALPCRREIPMSADPLMLGVALLPGTRAGRAGYAIL